MSAHPQTASDGLPICRGVEQRIDDVHATERSRIEPLVIRSGRDDDLHELTPVVLAVTERRVVRFQDVFVQGFLLARRVRDRPRPVHHEPVRFGRQMRSLDERFPGPRVIAIRQRRPSHGFQDGFHDVGGHQIAHVHVLLARHDDRVLYRRP